MRDQRAAFVVIGGVNTLIGYITFVGFELTVGPHAGYLVVLLLAHVTSVLCAFVLYRRLVFRVRGNVLRDLARFESVYLTALGVNIVLLPLFVEIGGLPVIAAQSVIVVLGAAISFFGHKHFSFRRPRPSS
jgi:putative flippase GtrA